MVIAVVGIGIVGKALVEHFTHLGHEVFQVERKSRLTLSEAARKADIVFIATRPIGEVAKLLKIASGNMRPSTLLIHGTSVETPHSERIDLESIIDRRITLAHVHFHFRPEVPLRETLRGQHITVKLEGGESGWRQWLEEIFEPFQPFIHLVDGDRHDNTTAVSQLLHMAVDFQTSWVWQNATPDNLKLGLTIMGPPGRFLARSVLRTASGAGVAAEILEGHPNVLGVLDQLIEALVELKKLIKLGRISEIEARLAKPRELVPSEMLDEIDTRTGQLIRLEADLQRHNVVLNFTAEQNVTGLLARVLGEFDRRGIDKTTTIAQTNPDGSCTFVIGVREHTHLVDEAVAAINSW